MSNDICCGDIILGMERFEITESSLSILKQIIKQHTTKKSPVKLTLFNII